MSPPPVHGAPGTTEQRFQALYADVYADALRFVTRRLPSEAASSAEDIVADALLVAWRRFEDAPQRADAQRAWVFGIARNCLLTSRRGSRRRDALTVRLADHDDRRNPTSSSHDGVIASLDLAAAWQRLTPAEQEVLALTVFEDLTSAQAALVLATTATAYRLRLMRACKALRSHLADTDTHPPEATGATSHRHPLTDDTSKATR